MKDLDETMILPYMQIEEFAPLFGYKVNSAKNVIGEGRFPVMTYKLGRRIVADRDVVDAYFKARRQQGLAALKESTGS